MKRNIAVYVFMLTAAMLLLTACSSAKEDTKGHESNDNMHESHAENGDLRELTASADQLPEFLKDKPEQMQLIYGTVPQYQALLEYIPCYCGCADSAEHKDNYDCFVFENKESGEIIWDDHGTRCGVCLETAAESIVQFNEGKSMEEIRNYIDDKYKEGFAKPTPTPMPA